MTTMPMGMLMLVLAATTEGWVAVPTTDLEIAVPSAWTVDPFDTGAHAPTREDLETLDEAGMQRVGVRIHDGERPPDEVTDNVIAIAGDCPRRLDEGLVDAIDMMTGTRVPGRWAKRAGGITTIAGVDVPWIAGTVREDRKRARVFQYIVPDGERCAFVSWTFAIATDDPTALVEQWMSETRGVQAPKESSRAPVVLAIVLGVGLAAVLLGLRLRR